jgi:hypothetical protein
VYLLWEMSKRPVEDEELLALALEMKKASVPLSSGAMTPPSQPGTYIALFEENLVKIGRSVCISQRFKGFLTTRPVPPPLLVWTTLEESDLHHQFQPYRKSSNQEFFWLLPPLLDFINERRQVEHGLPPVNLQVVTSALTSASTMPVFVQKPLPPVSDEWLTRIADFPKAFHDRARSLLTQAKAPTGAAAVFHARLTLWLSGPPKPCPLTDLDWKLVMGTGPYWVSNRKAWKDYRMRHPV